MSLRLFAADVVFLQRLLKSSGCYEGVVNGCRGEETEDALADFNAQTGLIASEIGTFDDVSERSVRTLHPKAQRAARDFLARVLEAGITVRITSGTRTYVEQDALFHKGRFGSRSPVVTNAPAGESMHNFGLAWDITITKGGRRLADPVLYQRVAQIGKTPELEWGGDWKTFIKRSHYQLATRLELSVIRLSFEAGRPIF